jgi:XisI protein
MDILKDKITKYQHIITTFLEERATIKAANITDCENVVIADTNHHHYQLLTMGWSGHRYIHSIAFHLDIATNGKIWIRANWTDTDIADVLEEHGVPKSDIVLGFVPDYMRELSDYAVA